jgi:hypothetical protein
MQTYRSLYEYELAKLVERAIEEERDAVANGFVSDFAAYKERTGFIRGLRAIHELMAEADKICQGGEGKP